MDLSLLAQLKEKMVQAKEFSKVWKYFLDHFGEDPAFMALGEPTRPPLLEAVFTQIARQLFQRDVDWSQVIFTSLPEHQFVHGGGTIAVVVGTAVGFIDQPFHEHARLHVAEAARQGVVVQDRVESS